LYTSPMPPAPSAASTSYGPSRVPGARLMMMGIVLPALQSPIDVAAPLKRDTTVA
jgi:hypothetical protein